MSKMKDEWFEAYGFGEYGDYSREADNQFGYDGKRSKSDGWGSDPYSDRPTSKELITSQDRFYLDVMSASDEAVEILIKKHEDYGSENISRAPGGAINGLAVRLHDKIARLANLMETGRDANYESLRDTFIDISNYGLIGIMVLDGSWESSKDTKK
jgi:hypothetical protein